MKCILFDFTTLKDSLSKFKPDTSLIISKISMFHSLGCPILLGTSRKRFIEHIVTKFDTPDRTGGTLSSTLYGLLQGVQLFRVHNVKEVNQGILVFNKILNTN